MTENQVLQQIAKRIGKSLGITLKLEWLSGHCPVQAEGKFYIPNTESWKYFYFRSRGEHWKFYIGKEEAFAFNLRTDPHYGEKYCDDRFGAGWISMEEALDFIKKSIELYIKTPEVFTLE